MLRRFKGSFNHSSYGELGKRCMPTVSTDVWLFRDHVDSDFDRDSAGDPGAVWPV